MVVSALCMINLDTSAFTEVYCRMGGLTITTEVGVPENILWMQSGHAQDRTARFYASPTRTASTTPGAPSTSDHVTCSSRTRHARRTSIGGHRAQHVSTHFGPAQRPTTALAHAAHALGVVFP
jgi:hypothetical protein